MRSLIAAAVFFLAAFAYFVWPTPWREYEIQRGPYQKVNVRVNRFTGETQELKRDGWE